MQHRLKDKDREKMTATCAVCGPNTPMKINYRGYVMCRIKWRNDMAKTSRYKGPRRDWDLEGKNYSDLVAELKGSQNNKCAICSSEMTRPHLDHDHKTGKIRGLLCGTCNAGLGMFKDSRDFLSRAISYLEQNRGTI